MMSAFARGKEARFVFSGSIGKFFIVVVALAAVLSGCSSAYATPDGGEVPELGQPQYQEGNYRGGQRVKTLRRHVHILATDWSPLRVKYLTPAARPDLVTPARATDDLRACTFVGQYVARGYPNGILEPAPTLSLSDPTPTPLCNVSASLITDCWIICQSFDIVTDAKRTMLASTLQSLAGTLESAVKVQPSQPWVQLYDKGCGEYNVTGYFGGNTLLVVTARPTPRRQFCDVTIVPCAVDEATDRATAVHINISPMLLNSSTATYTTLLRSTLQALAGNIDALNRFLFPGSPNLYGAFDPMLYPSGPLSGAGIILHGNYSEGNATFELPLPIVPGRRFRLVTPALVATAKTYFNCPTLTGIEIEDTGYEDGLIYFEKRLLKSEVLTMSTQEELEKPTVLSSFSLALLEDSGWYTVDYSLAQDTLMRWGRGLGCNFATLPCGKTGAWPSTYFCTNFLLVPPPSCTFDRRATGRCNLKYLSYDIPAAYRLFSDSLRWGSSDYAADDCPYVQADPNADSVGLCDSGGRGGSTAGGLMEVHRGTSFGVSARCFSSSVFSPTDIATVSSTSLDVRAPTTTCYRVTCTPSPTAPGGSTNPNDMSVYVRVRRQFVQCVTGRIVAFANPLTLPRSVNITNSTEVAIVESDRAGQVDCGSSVNSLCEEEQLGVGGIGYAPFWPTISGIQPNRGPRNGGTIISISGKYLTNCRHVRIGTKFVDLIYNFPLQIARGRTSYFQAGTGGLQSDGLGPMDVELWCNVTDVCPEGCAVDRLLKGFTLDPLAACNLTVDGPGCRDQPLCEWVDGRCVDRELTAAPTAAPPLTPAPLVAIDPGCFLEAPRFCRLTGRCALSLDLCFECGPSMVQCWNSRCETSFALCDCHPSTPVRCASGTCAATAADCNRICLADTPSPYRCWNGTCTADEGGCLCPPGIPVRCPITASCVADQNTCNPNQCPFSAPFRCWDDSCRASTRDCRCSLQKPFRCWEGSCVDDIMQCTCPNDFPYDCTAQKMCQPDFSFCATNATRAPCGVDQVRCGDGTCKAKMEDCPCTSNRYSNPVVQMTRAAGSMLQVDDWFIVPVEGQWSSCGMDYRTFLTYQWKIELLRNTTAAPAGSIPQTPTAVETATQFTAISLRSSLLQKATLRLPPMTLNAGLTYLLTVTVTAPNGKTAFATHRVTTYAPPITVQILGGNRDIPAASTLRLEAAIANDGAYPDVKNFFKWTCCLAALDGTVSCLPPTVGVDGVARPPPSCPQLLFSVADIHDSVATIASADGLPAGDYVFTAAYKTASQAIRVRIAAADLPVCYLYLDGTDPESYFENRPVRISSIIRFHSTVTQKWSINGSVLALETGTSLSLPAGSLPGTFETTVTLITTTSLDQVSQCSLRIRPRPAPSLGRCALRVVRTLADPRGGSGIPPTLPSLQSGSQGGGLSDIPVAGTAKLAISAYGWGSDPSLVYRFGYYDSSSALVLLSSDYLPTSVLSFTAPLVVGNPSLVTVRFAVQVASSTASDSSFQLQPLGNITCTMDLRSAPERSTITQLESMLYQLSAAVNASQEELAIDLGLRLSTMMIDPDVTDEYRRRYSAQIINLLSQLLLDPSSDSLPVLSTTTREKLMSTLNRLKNYLLTIAGGNGALVPNVAAICQLVLSSQTEGKISLNLNLDSARNDARDVLDWVFQRSSVSLSNWTLGLLQYAKLTAVRLASPGTANPAELSFTSSSSRVAGWVQYSAESELQGSTFVLPPAASASGASATALAQAVTLTLPNTLSAPPAPAEDRCKVVLIHFGGDTPSAQTPFGAGTNGLPLIQPPAQYLANQSSRSTLAPAAPPTLVSGVVYVGMLLESMLWNSTRQSPNFDNEARFLTSARYGTHAIVDGGLTLPQGWNPSSAASLSDPVIADAVKWNSVDTPLATITGAAIVGPQVYKPLKLVFTIVQDRLKGYLSGVGPASHNLTCYRLLRNQNLAAQYTWQKIGPATVTTQQTSSGGDTVAFGSCETDHFGIFALFDESWFPPATPAPTRAPSVFSLSNLRNLAEELPAGAAVGIALGALLLVGGIIGFCIRRRQQQKKAEEEKAALDDGGLPHTNFAETSQILVVSQLLQDDPELRSALELARVKARYAKRL